MPLTFDSIRALALKLPDVEDSTAYGQPALRVKGKILAATGHEPGSFAIKMPIDRRDELIAAAPDTYHVTDHYRPPAWVLVRYATACIPTPSPSCSAPPARPPSPQQNAAGSVAPLVPPLCPALLRPV